MELGEVSRVRSEEMSWTMGENMTLRAATKDVVHEEVGTWADGAQFNAERTMQAERSRGKGGEETVRSRA